MQSTRGLDRSTVGADAKPGGSRTLADMLRGGRNRQDSGLKVTGRICFHLGTQKAESRMRLGGRGMKELSSVSGEWGVEPDQSEGAKGQ